MARRGVGSDLERRLLVHGPPSDHRDGIQCERTYDKNQGAGCVATEGAVVSLKKKRMVSSNGTSTSTSIQKSRLVKRSKNPSTAANGKISSNSNNNSNYQDDCNDNKVNLRLQSLLTDDTGEQEMEMYPDHSPEAAMQLADLKSYSKLNEEARRKASLAVQQSSDDDVDDNGGMMGIGSGGGYHHVEVVGKSKLISNTASNTGRERSKLDKGRRKSIQQAPGGDGEFIATTTTATPTTRVVGKLHRGVVQVEDGGHQNGREPVPPMTSSNNNISNKMIINAVGTPPMSISTPTDLPKVQLHRSRTAAAVAGTTPTSSTPTTTSSTITSGNRRTSSSRTSTRVRATVKETGSDSISTYIKSLVQHELLYKDDEILLGRQVRMLSKLEEKRSELEITLLR